MSHGRFPTAFDGGTFADGSQEAPGGKEEGEAEQEANLAHYRLKRATELDIFNCEADV